MARIQTFGSGGEHARRLKFWLWLSGLASLVLGAVALVFPFAATLAAELILGAVLVGLGVVALGRAAFPDGVAGRLWTLLFGIVSIFTGAMLLLFPLEGALTMTMLISGFFVAAGIFKLVSSFYLRPVRLRAAGLPAAGGWGWVALSGVLSVLLGVILFLGLPDTAVWAIGMLIGIDLLVFGACEIGLALGLRRRP